MLEAPDFGNKDGIDLPPIIDIRWFGLVLWMMQAKLTSEGLNNCD